MIDAHAPAEVLRARRRTLASAVEGRILLLGHASSPRNFPANPYPFRQDSTFLYYVGLSLPNAAAVVEGDGRTTLYLVPPAPDDALWHGATPPPETLAAAVGADAWRPRAELAPASYRAIPTADPQANAAGSELVGRKLSAADPSSGDPDLLAAVIEGRLCRDAGEIEAMERAAAVTCAAHRAGMSSTRVGVTENAVQAVIEGTFTLHGMQPAYGSIVTLRGEVLHGRAEGLELKDGDLLLVDAGAEDGLGYACDVTRTWPASGRFTPRQAAIYDLVLASQEAAIALVRPGTRYRDVHLEASRVLARGLVDEGLLNGDVDGLVEQGAHAVFFPHGIGHLLGLDVHDMELYGDIGYPAGRSRADQFGLGYLRLDRDLRPGMVVTIEPGFYVVPEILADDALRRRLGAAVDWAAAETWIGFGGIRIEDDVLTTDEGARILTDAAPKVRLDVEALVGSGATPEERFGG